MSTVRFDLHSVRGEAVLPKCNQFPCKVACAMPANAIAVMRNKLKTLSWASFVAALCHMHMMRFDYVFDLGHGQWDALTRLYCFIYIVSASVTRHLCVFWVDARYMRVETGNSYTEAMTYSSGLMLHSLVEHRTTSLCVHLITCGDNMFSQMLILFAD